MNDIPKQMQKSNNPRFFEVSKENVIMTAAVQKKLPFLVLQKENGGALFVCSRFQQMDGGTYRCAKAYTKELCADASELSDLDVSSIESAAISAWKAGREQK